MKKGMVFWDVETRSRVNLSQTNGRVYAGHPSTKVLVSCWFDWDSKTLYFWSPIYSPEAPDIDGGLFGSLVPMGDPFEELRYTQPKHQARFRVESVKVSYGPHFPFPELLGPGKAWVALNSRNFDIPVWRGQAFPHSKSLIDADPFCRLLGLPASIEMMSKSLKGPGKVGKAEALFYSVPRVLAGSSDFPLFNHDGMVKVSRYCAEDTLVLASFWAEKIEPERPAIPAHEYQVMKAHFRCNERGIPFNPELASQVLFQEQENSEVLLGELREKSKLGYSLDKLISSPKRLLNYLWSKGWSVPNSQKETLLDFLEDPDSYLREGFSQGLDEVTEGIVRARLGLAKVTGGKLSKALALLTPRKSVTDCLLMAGAYPTARWTGKDFQPQNLTKPKKGYNVDLIRKTLLDCPNDPSALRKVLKPGQTIGDALASVLRLCVEAPEGFRLCAMDLSGIEARSLVYRARDWDKVRMYREGIDRYKMLASFIFKVPYDEIPKDSLMRDLGKILILGCGYGAGAVAILAQLQLYGVDISKIGKSVQELIDAYRDDNPLIAGERTGDHFEGIPVRKGGMWKRLEKAFRDALRGETTEINGLSIGPYKFSPNAISIELPSNRLLIYRNVRELPGDRGRRGRLTYTRIKKGSLETVELYGGLIQENVTQAECRDYVSRALVAFEEEGLNTVFHVHDELIYLAPEDSAPEKLETGLCLLTRTAPYDSGMIIASEGHVSKSYRKSPGPGDFWAVAESGQVIKRGFANV